MLPANSEKIALKIAFITSLGYAITVCSAAFIDSKLTSHVSFGARTYTYGYISSLLSLAVFLLTIFLFRKSETVAGKLLASCAPLIFAGVLALWAFRPEFPHAGIIIWIATYSIVAISTAWLHFVGPNLTFANDISIPYVTRVENLKSLLAVWRYFLIATIIVLTAGFVLWPFVVTTLNAPIVTIQSELNLLNTISLVELLFVLIALLTGPVHEICQHIISSQQKIVDISPKTHASHEDVVASVASTVDASITQKEKIQILVAEYNTLRAELVACGNKIYNMLAVGSAILTSQIVNFDKPYFWITIGIGVFLIVVFALLNVRDTRLLAARVKVLEREINTRTGESLLIWESQKGLYRNA